MEEELKALKQELEAIKVENKELKINYEEMKQEQERETHLKNKSIKSLTSHCKQFWKEISIKCAKDVDYVKTLIKNKTIKMDDMNEDGDTLLIIATRKGSYELVKLCLNLNANIHHKGKQNLTALQWSKRNAFYHIEQLLLFSEMNANISDRICDTADIINKQKGINTNILNELSLIGDQTKQLFEKIILELMSNIIQKKLAFSDDLLNLCWELVCSDKYNFDPLSSDLWKTISMTCDEIIQSNNKRDWFWFKNYIIPSTIWYKDLNQIKKKKKKKQEKDRKNVAEEKKNENESITTITGLTRSVSSTTSISSSYLYYKLLDLVEKEAENGLLELQKNIENDATKNKDEWIKLIKWEIPKNKLTQLPLININGDDNNNNNNNNNYTHIRQDNIPNGILSQYSYQQLIENGSNSKFDAVKFYDYNEYLSKLTLLAQIVDDDFQKSILETFGIDKYSNIGYIEHESKQQDYNNNNDDNIICYMRGPVKLISRAKAKAENDYFNEKYPTSACILDLNRCSLIFTSIKTLLKALEIFINKVYNYQSGNIIGIVRDKNGFKEYIKSPQYADIKLNVLIRGKNNNLLGEVQWLLDTMVNFKKKAHNLYAIQRNEEFVRKSVSMILPKLLNDDKQLFVAGCNGDVKELCRLMVNNNFTEKDIMKLDNKQSNESILVPICTFNNVKAFKFLKSTISRDLFIDRLFLINQYKETPITYAIECKFCSICSFIQDLFEMQQVIKMSKNDDFIGKIIKKLYRHPNHEKSRWIQKQLNIRNEQIFRLFYIQDLSIYNFKTFVLFIGEKAFIDYLFMNGRYNKTPFESCIEQKCLLHIEHILTFNVIKEKCLNDPQIIWRIIYWITRIISSDDGKKIAKYIVNIFNLNETKLKQIQSYHWVKPKANTYWSSSIKYWEKKISDKAISAILDAAK